jgi:hypothetical protein
MQIVVKAGTVEEFFLVEERLLRGYQERPQKKKNISRKKKESQIATQSGTRQAMEKSNMGLLK